MDAFEPPKYITSLIAAINDGAKAAQAGAFLFLLVGLYLLATAFSASDEDLLLGKAVTISQIGASLPVGFSFAIAPLVFVFLHIYTLIRYDLLAANVRQFREELRNTVPLEADRERCRQLLANVEFIVVLTTPRRSALYSKFWTWLFGGIIAAFPVAVLLLVQINALRYQSDLIVWTQRIWLALDFAALVWFFRRNTLDSSVWPEQRSARIRRWAGLLLAPVLIGAVNLLYLGTVPVDAYVIQYDGQELAAWHDAKAWLPYLAGHLASNPLDTLLCPQLNWGCRFLRVDHRTLVNKVRDEKAMGIMRLSYYTFTPVKAVPAGSDSDHREAAYAQAMAAIEGVFLRHRSLRFAMLDNSNLYAADLLNADLRRARFVRADPRGAELSRADLRGADLEAADLRGADLFGANLGGANLGGANLSGDILTEANLSGAYLSSADLSSAHMYKANLSGDILNGATLSGADLIETNLSGVYLRDVNLTGADLRDVNLSGATLTGADLRDTKNLTQKQLDPACGDAATKLPEGLTLKPCP